MMHDCIWIAGGGVGEGEDTRTFCARWRSLVGLDRHTCTSLDMAHIRLDWFRQDCVGLEGRESGLKGE